MKRIFLIPPRITLLISRNQGRILKIFLMTLVFITALYTKEYRGTYQNLINSHAGGIFYVLFGTLLFSLIFRRMRPWHNALLALVCTSVLEFIQYFRFPVLLELTRSKVFLYLLGNSYNPVDFLYYVVGAVIGCAVLLLIRNTAAGVTDDLRITR